MPKRPLSFPIALMLFLISALIAYWIFTKQGFPASDAVLVWRKMSPGWRAAVLACFIGNAYGLGAMLNAVLQRRQAP